jgi:DNA-nicking Smr family endonuclease
MKKRKQASGEVRTGPFKPMQGITPNDSVAKTRQGRLPPPTNTEDEEELFRRAVRGARRIDHGDEELKESPAPAVTMDSSDRPFEPEDDGGALFLQSVSGIGSASTQWQERGAEDGKHESRRSPSNRLRQLKRGSIRIARELDLHGSLRDEAISRLRHFLTNALGQGQQAVLVITGKGINSPEGPVLQGAVAEWLRTRGKAMIAEFHPAPRELGGSGAFVVFLKRRR